MSYDGKFNGNQFKQHNNAMRFWDKVSIKNKQSCWEWFSGLNSHGYGVFYLKGSGKYNHLLAHRYSYSHWFGVEIPKGILVLHKCDNPKCVNPFHLFLGTQAENMRDCYRKGRSKLKPYPQPGEKNPASKLSALKIFEIKTMLAGGITQAVIAKKYGVSQANISKIKTGGSWKQL